MRAAGRGTQPQPITSPPNGSAYLASARAEWQPTDTEKFWIKPLYEDDFLSFEMLSKPENAELARS